jgi:hypothetical protein
MNEIFVLNQQAKKKRPTFTTSNLTPKTQERRRLWHPIIVPALGYTP